MSDDNVVPFKGPRGKSGSKKDDPSTRDLLRKCIDLNPDEVLVIAMLPSGEVIVRGHPTDVELAMYLIEVAKMKLMGFFFDV